MPANNIAIWPLIELSISSRLSPNSIDTPQIPIITPIILFKVASSLWGFGQ